MTSFRSEIAQQPEVASHLLDIGSPEILKIAAAIRRAKPAALLIAARGTSDHAATYAKYLFEIRNRIPVSLAAPSAFTLYRPPKVARLCVIGISQSGSSPDVVAVLREAAHQGCLTIAITNRRNSALAQHAQHVLLCHADRERSVPASKTYTASLLLLAMLSHGLDPQPDFRDALLRVPQALESALALESELRDASRILTGSRLAVLGRGYHLATAEEVALKITETCYLMAQAHSLADFLHGPIAVVDPGFPVLLIEAEGPARRGMRRLAASLEQRQARVIIFTDSYKEARSSSTLLIRTGLPEPLTPLPFAVAGQLFAYHLALRLGINPDRPRGLKKVTITR